MQAGWHTVHKLYKDEYGEPKVNPLGEMKSHSGRTTTIRIVPDRVPRIRKELADMGVRHATVYGDLQSVSRAIGGSLGLL